AYRSARPARRGDSAGSADLYVWRMPARPRQRHRRPARQRTVARMPERLPAVAARTVDGDGLLGARRPRTAAQRLSEAIGPNARRLASARKRLAPAGRRAIPRSDSAAGVPRPGTG